MFAETVSVCQSEGLLRVAEVIEAAVVHQHEAVLPMLQAAWPHDARSSHLERVKGFGQWPLSKSAVSGLFLCVRKRHVINGWSKLRMGLA